MKKQTLFLLVLLSCFSFHFLQAQEAAKKGQIIEDWYNYIEPDQIPNSIDTFHMHQGGAVVGSMIFEKKRVGDVIFMHDISEMPGIVRETLDMEMNAKDLSMQEAKMQLTAKQNNTKVDMQLNWTDNHIKGIYDFEQNGQARKIPVDTLASKRIAGRGVVFGMTEALELEIDRQYKMSLFAFSSGQIWNMNLLVEGKETIEIQGRKIEVYKMPLTGGKVNNILYVTADEKQKLVRVDVIGQEMVIELVSEI